MIIILYDELAHLRKSVLDSAAHMTGNIGNLCPNHHTALVTKIVKIPVVLIMRKTDDVCTDLAKKIHIFKMMLGEKGISYLPTILMTTYTVERILFAVENKTVFRVNTESTATETG